MQQNLPKYIAYLATLLLLLCLSMMPTLAQDDCTMGRIPLDASPTMTGSIDEPLECADVPIGVAVDTTGTVQLDSGFTAWILIYAPNGRYYPQRNSDPAGSCTAAADMTTGEAWSVDSYFGLLGDPVTPFDVVLVAVDAAMHDALIQYWQTSCEAGLFEGLTPEELIALGIIYELSEITVNGVVDIPCGFVGGEDVEVAENSGEYFGEAWATEVSGADFVLSTDNDTLFSVLPEIALGDAELADGTLTFTPATDAFGVAVVTVDLLDDAGEVCQTDELIITVLPVNDPPNCDAAFADPDVLWPPNHRMVEITIGGITDADSTIFTFVIDSVESDEPENGLGDGNTSPDYEITDGTLDTGEATQTVSVRAERSGLGDGRTYTITFTVDDADFNGDTGDDFSEDDVIDGGTCTGTVTVFVPHDMRDGLTTPDDPVEDEGTVAGSLTTIGTSAITIYTDAPNTHTSTEETGGGK